MQQLLDFRLYHLASICSYPYGSGADRAAYKDGFYILHNLSYLAQRRISVYKKKQAQFTVLERYFGRPRKRHYLALFELEYKIYQDWLDYVKSLSSKNAKHFTRLWSSLQRALRAGSSCCGRNKVLNWYFDFYVHNPSQSRHSTIAGTVWAFRYILEGGPSLFWKQWWSGRLDVDSKPLADGMVEEWDRRSVGQKRNMAILILQGRNTIRIINMIFAKAEPEWERAPRVWTSDEAEPESDAADDAEGSRRSTEMDRLAFLIWEQPSNKYFKQVESTNT